MANRGDLIIGNYSYIAYNDIDVRFPNEAKLIIGDFCSIAEDCIVLLSGEHNTRSISTFPFDKRLGWEATNETHFSKGDVLIGNDVWLGKGVVIMSGVSIGDGAVVGAYSVVTKDIGPYEIWAGNPVKFIRQRFDDYEINLLLTIQWWHWPIEKIREASSLLTQGNVGKLYQYWEENVCDKS